MALTPQTDRLTAYLAADDIIDHTHPAIRELTARLRSATREHAAAAAFTYVRDQLEHSYDVDLWSAAYRASDVLTAGNSICHGQAHLLTALLRAQGIPAGLCYQQLSALRGLVAVHWAGGWVRLDPRTASARFATTPETEQLPYPDAPSTATVYASVPEGLATCLAKARPGVPGFDYLDARLPMNG